MQKTTTIACDPQIFKAYFVVVWYNLKVLELYISNIFKTPSLISTEVKTDYPYLNIIFFL